mmetsp:Transcript_76429/g.120711  ORF Transcript_76429/g.120711 Transcript_76429/m.120711 type:complete len:81 (-) Transcript_76429:287-529(-)
MVQSALHVPPDIMQGAQRSQELCFLYNCEAQMKIVSADRIEFSNSSIQASYLMTHQTLVGIRSPHPRRSRLPDLGQLLKP